MATNRPLQNLISTTGNPATRSSSSLVTPQLAALADPPTHTADARLLNWLVAETIKTLRESELAATTRQDRDLYAAQRHVESLRLSVPTSRGAAAEEEQPPPLCRTEPDETAVRARLDVIGYRVGWATAERLARDRPRFPLAANPTPSSAPPPPPSSSQSTLTTPPTPQLDTLEFVKFICKDVWISLFDKQVDNLRTNHRGVYVVSDNALPSLRGLSPVPVPSTTTTAAATGRREEIIDEEAEEERNQLQNHVEAVLAFPSGIIRGALAQLGIASLVSGTADLSTLPQASFQIKTGAAAFPPAPPPPPSVAPTSNAGAGRTSTPTAIATASAAAAGGTTVISTSAAASAVSSRGGTPVIHASSSSNSTGAAASASQSTAPPPR